MPTPADAPREVLFGLVALQNGLIDQAALFAAAADWAAGRGGPTIAEALLARGVLDAEDRELVDALVSRHLKRSGGDAEKSLAGVGAGASTREGLSKALAISGTDLEATVSRIPSGPPPGSGSADDRTDSYTFGSTTSGGGRFRVLRPHARGGLGAVFVAVDEELHREVALKQIIERHADDPHSRSRFLLEAEITGGLEHPGIVPVYGLGHDDAGRPFYAMRFVRGDNLKEAIAAHHADGRSGGALGLTRLLRRFLDVCNAIEYAHERGVVHRDIKPGNVIVGRYGETLVVDWGLAKAVGKADLDRPTDERTLVPTSSGSSETLPGMALGTPAYMSPEQAAGDLDRLGPRSDVYSLGATLYCLLTGRPPFEAPDAASLLRRVRAGDFPRPREANPDVDPALEAVCLRAMARDPAARYGSARSLAEEVERWLADDPVSAYREPVFRRLRRWARRHRTATAAGAVAAAMAVVGLAAVLTVQARANAALRVKNGQLEAGLRREAERFALARDAVRLFHGEVSEDLLLREPRFAALRTRLLRGAADFYGRLERLLRAQTDQGSRAELGRAYDGLGALTEAVGRRSEALAVHLRAAGVRRDLGDRLGEARSLLAAARLRSDTGDPAGARADALAARSLAAAESGDDARLTAALAEYRLGALDALAGKPEEALAAHIRARDARQALADARPDDPARRRDLAASRYAVGTLLADAGRHAAALASHEAARALRDATARADPSDAASQTDLAQSHNAVGVLLHRTGRPADALAAYRAAEAVQHRLAEANPAVTRLQAELALSRHNLGLFLKETGHPAEAEAAYRSALEAQRAAVATDPDVPGLRADLALTHTSLAGHLKDSGRPDDALAELRAAAALRRELAAAAPADPARRHELALAHVHAAVLLYQTGRPAESADEYRAALPVQEELASSHPENPDYPAALGYTLHGLGVLAADSGDVPGALAHYARARSVRRTLADAHPAVAEYRAALAYTLHGTALLLTQAGRAAEALGPFAEEESAWRALLATRPEAIEYRKQLAGGLIDHGDALRDTGRAAAARACYDEAAAGLETLTREAPEAPVFRSWLGYALRRRGGTRAAAGDTAGAASDWRRAAGLFEALKVRRAEEWFEFACCRAALAATPGAAASAPADAVALLRRACEAGYRNLAAVRTEPALDPLRTRPDFAALLLDLAVPTDPFAR